VPGPEPQRPLLRHVCLIQRSRRQHLAAPGGQDAASRARAQQLRTCESDRASARDRAGHGEYEADCPEASLVGVVRRLHRGARAAGGTTRGGGQRRPRCTSMGTSRAGVRSRMRADRCPAPFFPTTGWRITRARHRRLSELQGDDPLILTLARGHYCPKEHQQHLELAAFYPKIAVAYTRSPRSRPTTTTRSRSSERRSAPSGRSSPTRAERCRRTSTFRSTPTPRTTR
jgi:hypothetical protein